MKIIAVAGQRKDRETVSAKLVSRLCEQFDGCYEQSRETGSLPPDANLYVQYGYKRTAGLDAAMEKNIPFIILDRGYFADRNTCFSVSINGFHGLSMPVLGVEELPARNFIKLEPMREPGDYVYLYGQMQNDRACRGLVVETWLRKEAQKASEATGKPCKIRPHPLTLDPWEPQLPPLEESFEEAYAGVFWTSTATVQALIAGVRCLALHPANPVFNACARSYAELAHNNRVKSRGQVMHELSWRNYRLYEVAEAAEYIRIGFKQAETEALACLYDTAGLRV